MKQKNLIICLASLIMCMFTIVIGVYAAKTASMKVQGTLSFEAHDTKVDIDVFMYGHADDNGEPVAKTARTEITGNSPIQVVGADVTNTTALGGKKFTDLNSTSNQPEDIVIDFEFTNKSDFDVLASVNAEATTCDNASVRISDSGAVIMSKSSGSTKTGKLSVTLSLKSTNGSYTTFSTKDLTISIKFEKATYRTTTTINKFSDIANYSSTVQGKIGAAECCDTIEYTNDAPYRTYVDAFPYYITMGTYGTGTTANINWLIVGKMNSFGEVTALTANDKAVLASNKMINGVDYVVLSEKALEDRVFVDSTKLNSDYTTNTTYGTNANDYATSDIRAYLRDTSSNTGFAKKYGLENSLNIIKYRSIQEMYSTDTIHVWNDGNYEAGEPYEIATKDANGQTFPSNVSGKTSVPTGSDAFWLLSETEIRAIFAEDTIVCETDFCNVFMSGRTTHWEYDYSYYWWLRSPDSASTYDARYFYYIGYSHYDDVNNYRGVRAAFLI